MSSPNLVNNSGNVLMRDTPEYQLEYLRLHGTPTNNKKTRKNRKHGGYTEANIAYEVSMAERGYTVSKFARNAVRKALQKKGMNLSANGKIVRGTTGGKRRGTRRNRRN